MVAATLRNLALVPAPHTGTCKRVYESAHEAGHSSGAAWRLARPGGTVPSALLRPASAHVGAVLAGARAGRNRAMTGSSRPFAVQGAASRPGPGRQLPAGEPMHHPGAHPVHRDPHGRQCGGNGDENEVLRPGIMGAGVAPGSSLRAIFMAAAAMTRQPPDPAAGGAPGRPSPAPSPSTMRAEHSAAGPAQPQSLAGQAALRTATQTSNRPPTASP